MNFISDPIERTRFIKFAIVGGIGTLVDFAVFNLFATLIGVAAVTSSVISFTAAVVNNYVLNRLWTYPDSRSKSLTRQMTEFTVVNVLGLAIRTPIFALLESPLGELYARSGLPQVISPVDFGHNLALAVAILVVMFWNYFVNRYWTFNDVN